MYEELRAPIPDVDAYLRRLKLSRPAQPDIPYLDQLIYAHQRYITFENLDSCLLHTPVSLEISRIFQKIIRDGRGGFCFELNALLQRLLTDLGYRAYGCMARILRKKDFIPPVLHRGILVEQDGLLYFCDVGYGGPMPPGALPVKDGADLHAHSESYYMEGKEPGWWTVSRLTSQEQRERIMQFYTFPQDEVNFLPLCGYCANSPDSVFTQKPYLNRRTADGSVSILGEHFTRVSGHSATTVTIQTQEQFSRLLETEFQLALPPLPGPERMTKGNGR